VRTRNIKGVRRDHDRESGQSTVEFALILFPLLLLVAGIIQFGIALNYWLDMQRIANQGARWAAVNNWPPDCPRGSASCTGSKMLQETLKRQMLTEGLQNNSTTNVELCYPDGSKGLGHPVRIQIRSSFDLLPILGVGSLNLKAKATMRLEHTQEDPVKNGGLLTGEVSCS
jgi:hypothetical protein